MNAQIKSIVTRSLPSLNNKLLSLFMPGKYKLNAQEIILNGHISLIPKIKIDSGDNISFYMDYLVSRGNVPMIQGLRNHGIHCNVEHLYFATECGELAVIQDLQANGIHYSESDNGMFLAVSSGHVHIIQYFESLGIHCTQEDADDAACNGQLEVVRYLRQRGIDCSDSGALSAEIYNHIEVVEDLKAHGIFFVDEENEVET